MRSIRWCRPCCCRTRRCAAPHDRIQQLEQASGARNRASPAASSIPCATRCSASRTRRAARFPTSAAGATSRPVWNTGQVLQQTQGQGQYDQGYGQATARLTVRARRLRRTGPYGSPQSAFGGGGSFLGTAAATAAGVVGGSLLMNSIRGMMGGGHQRQAFGDTSHGEREQPVERRSVQQLGWPATRRQRHRQRLRSCRRQPARRLVRYGVERRQRPRRHGYGLR